MRFKRREAPAIYVGYRLQVVWEIEKLWYCFTVDEHECWVSHDGDKSGLGSSTP